MAVSQLQHEIKKRKPFDSAEVEAFLNLQRTAAMLAGEAERLIKAQGISGSAYNALRILRGARLGGDDALPCLEIAERMITPVPDITRLIDRLEAGGLVERRRTKEDRRVVLVSITKRGMDVLSKLDRPLTELHKEQMSRLTNAELKSLNQLLVKARTQRG